MRFEDIDVEAISDLFVDLLYKESCDKDELMERSLEYVKNLFLLVKHKHSGFVKLVESCVDNTDLGLRLFFVFDNGLTYGEYVARVENYSFDTCIKDNFINFKNIKEENILYIVNKSTHITLALIDYCVNYFGEVPFITVCGEDGDYVLGYVLEYITNKQEKYEKLVNKNGIISAEEFYNHLKIDLLKEVQQLIKRSSHEKEKE